MARINVGFEYLAIKRCRQRDVTRAIWNRSATALIREIVIKLAPVWSRVPIICIMRKRIQKRDSLSIATVNRTVAAVGSRVPRALIMYYGDSNVSLRDYTRTHETRFGHPILYIVTCFMELYRISLFLSLYNYIYISHIFQK